MDITNRDEIVRRLRQLTGMRDPRPDRADPRRDGPSSRRVRCQRQVRMQEARIADKETSAAQKNRGRQPRRDARKMKAATATDNVGTLKAALEAA